MAGSHLDRGERPLRVIQVGTGHVGKHALRMVLDRPGLELVGVAAFNPDKVGRDVGELIGRDPVGVRATAGLKSVLDLDADACLYLPTINGRMREVNDELSQLLSAGVDVVTTAITMMINPGSLRPDVRERLEAACAQGGSTCMSTGIDPGILTDIVPFALVGASERVDSVSITEITTYSPYQHTDQVLFDFMGFGWRPGETPPFFDPRGLRNSWGGALGLLAARLGLPEVQDVTVTHELAPAAEDFTFQDHLVPAGTAEAIRFEVTASTAGGQRLSLGHVTRLRDDAAPDWPRAPRSGTYRFEIDGSPRLTCDLSYAGENGDATTGGLIITAARAVNALPVVRAAPPGIVSVFDLPSFAVGG